MLSMNSVGEPETGSPSSQNNKCLNMTSWPPEHAATYSASVVDTGKEGQGMTSRGTHKLQGQGLLSLKAAVVAAACH